MEIVIPPGPGTMEFDFNSARASPQLSAPSSPRGFGLALGLGQQHYCYASAPSSPSRIAEFYQEFDNLYNYEMMTMEGNHDDDAVADSCSSSIPFDWEQKPGTPKSSTTPRSPHKREDEFAFNFSLELEQASLTAEELFDGGRIKPLEPPPHKSVAGQMLSPRSPRSSMNPVSQGKKIIRDAFSPRSKNKQKNPFADNNNDTHLHHQQQERGRQRRTDHLSSGSRRVRSLSPYRVSDFSWEDEEEKYQQRQQQRQQQKQLLQQQANKQSSINSKPPSGSTTAAATKSSASRKWRFTDFLLFRSASEGRAADKDPLRKYSGFNRNDPDIPTRNTGSRSTEGSGSGRRKSGAASAHELHYTKNKAAAQDMKKKTYLPYRSGIFGFHGLGPFSRS